MAIQHRRGAYSAFDPSRMMPGEWAVVLSGDGSTLDGKAVYICFAAGDVKRMATVEDLYSDVEAIEADITADLTEICEAAAQEAIDASAELGTLADRVGYLEGLSLDYTTFEAQVAELQECCRQVRSDFGGLAHTLATLSGEWQFFYGVAHAPTAVAFSVTGTKGTIAGTVSGTKLVLD